MPCPFSFIVSGYQDRYQHSMKVSNWNRQGDTSTVALVMRKMRQCESAKMKCLVIQKIEELLGQSALQKDLVPIYQSTDLSKRFSSAR